MSPRWARPQDLLTDRQSQCDFDVVTIFYQVLYNYIKHSSVTSNFK
jgi:hypothetical protein